ncbi:MAG: Holliday junction resolvase Hjc [Candidatus Bathyarchaeia archaeon]
MSLRELAKGRSSARRGGRLLSGREVRRMKKRGYDAERELVQKLREMGFEAVRIPVSAPSSEPLPDVFAIKGDMILAFEVKSQGSYTYFKKEQVAKLHEFLNIHRQYPKRLAVLAAKFRYKGWAFIITEKPMDYSIRMGGGMSLKELLRRISQGKSAQD